MDFHNKIDEIHKIMRSIKSFFEEINDDCLVIVEEFSSHSEFSQLMNSMINNNLAISKLSLGIINNSFLAIFNS